MIARFLIVISGLVLVIPSALADATPVQVLAKETGRVLGAAAQCDMIPGVRLNAAASRIGARIRANVAEARDMADAEEVFSSGMREGRQEIAQGTTDCVQAETAFGDLERRL